MTRAALILLAWVCCAAVADMSRSPVVEVPYHSLSPLPSRTKRQAYPVYGSGDVRLTVDSSGIRESGAWGNWEEATDCSRECGGGVRMETRACGSGRCNGPSRRYISCSVHDCPPESKDFRSAQCSAYNDQALEGKYYEWTPSHNRDNRCALLCRPKDESWKYMWKPKVTDGTPCDDFSTDICVDGLCLPLGCDGKLGSHMREDKCLVCGGEGDTCKTIDDFIDERDLTAGYHEVIVLPVGATSIHIQEMRPSGDGLAVHNSTGHYYLNGNFQVQLISDVYEIGGTKFAYETRSDKTESLQARGPLKEELTIAVLHQQDSRTSAIRFEFSVPIDDSIQFLYKPDEWQQCSVTCGKGVQERRANCWDIKSERYTHQVYCENQNATEPELNRTCETVDCAPQWHVSDWEECSASCGDSGSQYRVIFSEQVLADGRTTSVDDSQCSGDRPTFKQTCNRFACPEWNAGPWSSCSEKCGPAVQYRSVTCRSEKEGDNQKMLPAEDCPTDNRPEPKRDCNLGPCEGMHFVLSDWELCSKCNDTTETRDVECFDASNEQYPKEKCVTEDEPSIPKDQRPCVQPVDCLYRWHVSEWGKCSTTCGHGHETRRVFCAIEQHQTITIMDASHCDEASKPDSRQECINEETCTGSWYTSVWTECSEECDGGTQTRKAVCLNYDKKPVPNVCDELDMPTVEQDCNMQECPTCGNSTFGCCPDNSTFADGEFNEGCSNCTISEFGCCKDNYTEALGEDYLGCPGFDMPTTEQPEEDEVEGSGEADLDDKCQATDIVTGEIEMIPCADIDMSFTDMEDDDEIVNGTLVEESKHCSRSDFGCCPDWYSPAEGTSFAGCPEVELGDCNGTRYGCCPDEVTLSRGPNLQACGEPSCSASYFGCCKDRRTIAFGPHYAGCDRSSYNCEQSEFGCCPDGETAAMGDNGKGCDSTCKIAKHGCCPDGMTAAQGPKSEGCGCAYSRYGCCPDGKTEAEGPSFRGCPESCTQSTYGCCPDGSTRAQGTNMEGCPCQYSQYGCCPDGQTSARGMNEEGCDDCRLSKFGCCMDGQSSARGSQYEGCPATTPSPPVDMSDITPEHYAACELQKDAGEVVNYAAAYYFDVAEAECKQFWYGGSGGNLNRHSTMENCNSVCVSPPNDGGCYLPKSEGSKRCASAWVLAYHYNPHSQQCGGFYWSGCGGNNNRFASWEECMDRCSHVQVEGGPAVEPVAVDIPERPQPQPETQPQTQPQPQPTRAPAPAPNTRAPKTQPRPTARPQVYEPKDQICVEEQSAGPCKDYQNMYFYNRMSGNCEQFLYGGCGGNYNRFRSFAECESRCIAQGQQSGAPTATPGSGVVVESHRPTRSLRRGHLQTKPMPVTAVPTTANVCDLPLAQGNCGERLQRWYYEKAAGVCLGFQYSGCAGNGNQFMSAYDCEQTCERSNRTPLAKLLHKTEHGSHEEVRLANLISNDSNELSLEGPKSSHGSNPSPCDLSEDAGPCDTYQLMYAFDRLSGVCRRFYWGGCEGNANRFQDYTECERACVMHADTCSLPKVHGPCTNSVKKYYFDKSRGTCETFSYGGCEGNTNNFDSFELCEQKCVSSNHQRSPVNKDVIIDHSVGDSQAVTHELCQLPHDVGPCRAYIPSFYYDTQLGYCTNFVYGGCGGNQNRFDSRQDCERMCATADRQQPLVDVRPMSDQQDTVDRQQPLVDVRPMSDQQDTVDMLPAAEQPVEVLVIHDETEHRPTSLLPELCELGKDVGGCYGSHLRWFYDSELGECGSMLYSGCGGNANRFDSDEACKRACGIYRDQDVCEESVDLGSCSHSLPKWFFASNAGECRMLMYTGCGGNGNRFSSKEECEQLCVDGTDRSVMALPLDPVCSQPLTAGGCQGAHERWHYSTHSETCEQFIYTGCGGNQNNFEHEQACREQCDVGRTRGLLLRNSNKEFIEDVAEHCQLERETGPCSDAVTQYYYDTSSRTCRPFTYGGCRGNANRFSSAKACERACVPKRAALLRHDIEEICTAPFEQGPCTNEAERYYYDAASGLCRSFVFGGCEGNKNRFVSIEECEQTCSGVFERSRKDDPPKVITQSAQKHIGEQLRLDCRLAAPSNEQVVWFRNRHQIGDDSAEKRVTILGNGSLVIDVLEASDAGEYACALGVAGLVSQELTITIQPAPVTRAPAAHKATKHNKHRHQANQKHQKEHKPHAHQSESSEAHCLDDRAMINCRMIVSAGLCSHERYGRHCCRTCMMHGKRVP